MTLFLPLGTAWVLAVVLAPLDGRKRWVGRLAVAGQAVVLAAVTAVALAGAAEVVTGGWPAGIGIRLRADALALTFAAVAAALLLAGLAYEHVRGLSSRAAPALFATLSVGLLGAFFTADLFNFYVFFEITMVAAVALATYGQGPAQLRAGYTFLAVSFVGSVVFLAAVAIAYRAGGTLDLDGIAAALASAPARVRLLAASALFSALGLKLGLFPFHAWVPPVYRGSHPAVAAVLSGAVALIGAYGLLRLLAGMLPDAVDTGRTVLLAVGAASAVYGGVLAYSCRQASEALAYSSVAQNGFVLAALALQGRIALAAAVTFALVNALNKALLFFGLGAGGRFVSAAFAVGALSVAGLPPTAGFWAKLAVLRVALREGEYVLLAALLAASALSLIYVLPVFQRRFWRDRETQEPSPVLVRVIVAGLALVVVAIGLWPAPLWRLAELSAAALGGTR